MHARPPPYLRVPYRLSRGARDARTRPIDGRLDVLGRRLLAAPKGKPIQGNAVNAGEGDKRYCRYVFVFPLLEKVRMRFGQSSQAANLATRRARMTSKKLEPLRDSEGACHE